MSIFNHENLIQFTVRGNVRSVSIDQKVKVYRNLNKPEQFSVVALDGEFKNKVIAYGKSIELNDAYFKVSIKSRERLMREKTRNVHAWCIGRLKDIHNDRIIKSGEAVTYQPFIREDFYFEDSLQTAHDIQFSTATLQGSNVLVTTSL